MHPEGFPRPEVRDVVPVEIAEQELSAVRALLDGFRASVSAEESAAAQAEGRINGAAATPPHEVAALEESQELVVQLATARRAELRALADQARREAEDQVREAARRAAELGAASRRDAAELLRERAGFGVGEPMAPVASDDVRHWGEPLPGLQHWSEPPVPEAAAVVPPTPMRPRVEVTKAHEQFWQEEQKATAARSAGIAPIEALLPTAALVILLVAVLLLIG